MHSPAAIRRSIPWAMVWGRIALGPGIALAAHRDWDGKWLGLIILIALLDDIYDGVLARRWHCDTSALRLADSLADTVFYLGVAGALWLRQPQVLYRNWHLLAVLFALEGARYIFDLTKFGKAASYHSYLAKCWGLIMATALIAVVSFGGSERLVRASILIGILANLEGLAMSLLLLRWQNDVKTLPAAWRLRRQQATVQRVPDGQHSSQPTHRWYPQALCNTGPAARFAKTSCASLKPSSTAACTHPPSFPRMTPHCSSPTPA